MRPIANWRDVLRRAWSIRFIAIAAVLSGLEIVLPLVEDILPVPRGVFAALSGLATAGAFVSRIIAQKDIPDG